MEFCHIVLIYRDPHQQEVPQRVNLETIEERGTRHIQSRLPVIKAQIQQ